MTTREPLAARLAAISKDIGYIEKGGYNEAQKYKFVSESDVVAALKPKLAEAGIVVVPSHRLLSVEPYTTSRGSQQFLTTVESTFTFMDGTESIVVQTIGQGADAGDKGIYKAMTGAKKYALLQAFLLATGDDPEIARDDERAPASRGNKQPVEAGGSNQDASSAGGKVAIPARTANKLSETQKKRIFSLGDEAKLSKEALGELRLKITGKHSSAQMTAEDGEKLIGVLQEQIATLNKVAAATGGTVVAK